MHFERRHAGSDGEREGKRGKQRKLTKLFGTQREKEKRTRRREGRRTLDKTQPNLLVALLVLCERKD